MHQQNHKSDVHSTLAGHDLMELLSGEGECVCVCGAADLGCELLEGKGSFLTV